jgi:hypothetical protein
MQLSPLKKEKIVQLFPKKHPVRFSKNYSYFLSQVNSKPNLNGFKMAFYQKQKIRNIEDLWRIFQEIGLKLQHKMP